MTYIRILTLSLALLCLACNKDKSVQPLPVTTLSDSMADIIYAYTSGIVQTSSPIRVRFTYPVVDADAVLSEAEANLLQLSPSVKGTLTWEDSQTLRFIPDDELVHGTQYTATVAIGKITGRDLPESEFQFHFKTEEPNYQVEIVGLQATDHQQPHTQMLLGSVTTSDHFKLDDVKQLLTAKIGNSKLPIEWEHQSGTTAYDFTVKGINRSKKEQDLKLEWDGASLSSANAGSTVISVPSSDDFKVSKVTEVNRGGRHILVQFTDPLQPQQDLQGLIRLSGNDLNARYDIDRQFLRLYIDRQFEGAHTLELLQGIVNTQGKTLQHATTWMLNLDYEEVGLRLTGKGVIMPNSEKLLFPFEATGLDHVELEISKIFNNNVLQFLQTNALDESNEMERVSRRVFRKRIALNALHAKGQTNNWKQYALDLNDFIKQDPQAIYQVTIGFLPGYTSQSCEEFSDIDLGMTTIGRSFDESAMHLTDMYYGPDGYYNDYYQDRDEPCKLAYYNSHRFITRNVFSSNIGLIAKSSEGHQMMVTATDIRTADPMSGVNLKFYDYQQQLLAEAHTDASGQATIKLERDPFVVVAESGKERGYLRTMDNEALALNRFDIGGVAPQEGWKGFLYGDRGVWRPGDSVFINLLLENDKGSVPQAFPVTATLIDPRGKEVRTFAQTKHIGPIYPLHFATPSNAPTGNWTLQVKAGGATFSKRISIETVKPNRLKVALEVPEAEVKAGSKTLDLPLQVNWLHGAPARNLQAKVEMQAGLAETSFSKFTAYKFTDPARTLSANPVTVFDGKVGNDGSADLSVPLTGIKQNAPGKMRLNFESRAFEKGGDMSVGRNTTTFSPYEAYTGVYIPENKYGSKRLNMNEENTVSLVSVDEAGNSLQNRNLSVGLYRIEWRWWWENGEDNVARYNSNTHHNALEKAEVRTNANGKTDFKVNVSQWGRYLLRVCDTESGHCSGEYFYAGYPWYGSDGRESDGAEMLTFVADKKSYEVGDKVSLSIPATESGKCLVSLETGSEVLSTEWFSANKGDNTYTFTATAKMAPTVYAHVTYLQPHAQTDNDMPIRMYGVIPIEITDPATKLSPELQMPNKLEPNETFEVRITEADDHPMAYTIAIVDEGLLDLTNFQTPDPHDGFFAKEALGIKTWDMYQQVLGAFGGQLNSILTIGGDGAIVAPIGDQSANRFKPVVLQAGPFYLKKGETATHSFTMPNYVGSVRAMVVAAADNRAYGHTEKTIAVKKPLMLLTTLPRVLGPQEELHIPINIFAMENGIRDVRVSVKESSGLVEFPDGSNQSLTFNSTGDQMAYVHMKTKDRTGIAKFTIQANSGQHRAVEEIEIDIRNPNPFVTSMLEATVQSGDQWNETFMPLGTPGTNTVTLEVSNMPPIDLGRRLRYLLRYPHGCIEQTTSAGFPQLYVHKLLKVSEEQAAQSKKNVLATIRRLYEFQMGNGGFEYWPGTGTASDWGTSYAGHFLLEAQQAGYAVSGTVIDNWINYQKGAAKHWDAQYDQDDGHRNGELAQAYRLYTLALAGKPVMSAMNRLRQQKNLHSIAAWRLAAAYALAGKENVAKDLIEGMDTEVASYQALGYTYGSDLRDEAMILETLLLLNDQNRAGSVSSRIAQQLSSGQWLSTQTIGYSLLAIGKYVGDQKMEDDFKFAYSIGSSNTTTVGSNEPVVSIDLPISANSQQLQFINSSNSKLYVRLILHGQPLIGAENAVQNNLKMTTHYTDLNGNDLSIDNLPQGQDFVAVIKVTHPGNSIYPYYQEMALEQIFPSGWEIINSRMTNVNGISSDDSKYQDIRDDRVYTYFDVYKSKSKVYRVQLNAAYQGRYYLPAVQCYAMYNEDIKARTAGQWVQVVSAESY